jgi:hypothetical protein
VTLVPSRRTVAFRTGTLSTAATTTTDWPVATVPDTDTVAFVATL